MKRIQSLCLLVLALLTMFAVIPVSASEVNTVTECLDITMANKNIVGENYKWWNIEEKLVLSNCSIVTTDRFGIKLPKDCTVILEGVNYITAQEAAIACEGNVTFSGEGTLIMTAEENGIINRSDNRNERTRLLGGNYEITTNGDCIRSDYAELGIVAGTYTLNSKNANAINGCIVKLNGGTITANGSVVASRSLHLSDVFANITSGQAALQCPNGITAAEIAIEAGAAEGALTAIENIDAYAGQNCISVVSTDKHLGQSSLLGAGFPAYWDYLILGGAIVLFVLVVALVLVLRWKRLQRQHAYREANIERMRMEAKLHIKKDSPDDEDDDEE